MIDLCTEQDVLSISGGESDASLTGLIAQASRWIQTTMLSRDFEAADALVEVVDGTGTEYIYAPRPPVRALTTVEIYDGVAGGVATWRALTAAEGYVFETDYSQIASELDKARTIGAIMLRDGVFVDRPRSYRATYNGGLASNASAVPGDLRRACALTVAFALNASIRGGPGIQARTIVGETTTELITFADRAAQEEVLEILDGWKIG